MIERVVLALQALAAPPEARVKGGSVAEEMDALVLDFDDALRLMLDCPQIQLEPAQREALLRLEEHLESLTGAGNAQVAGDAEVWACTRGLTAETLRTLGHPIVPHESTAAPKASTDAP